MLRNLPTEESSQWHVVLSKLVRICSKCSSLSPCPFSAQRVCAVPILVSCVSCNMFLLKQIAAFPLEVFGAVSHYESYAYTVVKDYGSWTVRRYAPAVAAQVQEGGGEDSSFMTLAAYIG
eukprot:3955702-Amphidinium_carterae.1